MEQTAIQELIQEMEQLKQTKLYQGSFKAIEDCMALAYSKLEMEKEQLINFTDNYVDSCVIPNENMAIPTTMDVPNYYNETFKQQ